LHLPRATGSAAVQSLELCCARLRPLPLDPYRVSPELPPAALLPCYRARPHPRRKRQIPSLDLLGARSGHRRQQPLGLALRHLNTNLSCCATALGDAIDRQDLPGTYGEDHAHRTGPNRRVGGWMH
jgi:hypothetical protein